MTTIVRINATAARTDPESVFGEPDDVVREPGLTRGQKISALEKWSADVEARLDAVAEGMSGERGAAYTKDAELLKKIGVALTALKERAPIQS
ncbi:MAG: hypothetical protein AB7K67_16565 [Hyphomicrobiaceae bacterium]